MEQSKEVGTVLVGRFENALVLVGNMLGKQIDPNDFKKPYHDLSFKGSTYRFINPENLSEDSIDELKKKPNSYVFGGDLKGMLIEVTSGGIRSNYLPNIIDDLVPS